MHCIRLFVKIQHVTDFVVEAFPVHCVLEGFELPRKDTGLTDERFTAVEDGFGEITQQPAFVAAYLQVSPVHGTTGGRDGTDA